MLSKTNSNDCLLESYNQIGSAISILETVLTGLKAQHATIESSLDVITSPNVLTLPCATSTAGKAPVVDCIDGIYSNVPKSIFAYWYEGRWYGCDSGKDLLVSVLRMLSRDNPDFLGKYAEEVNSEGRTRAYVARTKGELYPDNIKLQKTEFEILPEGWFLGTNMSNIRKTRMLRSACKVLGLRYGIDLVVKIGR